MKKHHASSAKPEPTLVASVATCMKTLNDRERFNAVVADILTERLEPLLLLASPRIVHFVRKFYLRADGKSIPSLLWDACHGGALSKRISQTGVRAYMARIMLLPVLAHVRTTGDETDIMLADDLIAEIGIA